jgi:hypothetical protein
VIQQTFDFFKKKAVIIDVDNELLKLKACLENFNMFEERYSNVVNKAVSYVVDSKNTGKNKIMELGKAEKTIFGTKVETYLRNEFTLYFGKKLDFNFNGIEFDSKATIGKNFMIPSEAIGEICLLTVLNEAFGTFDSGIVRADCEILSKGENRDGKRKLGISNARITWLIKNKSYKNS